MAIEIPSLGGINRGALGPQHCKSSSVFTTTIDDFCDDNSEHILTNSFYFDAIIANLDSTGRWRAKQAIKYPADARNTHAATELARLAETPFQQVDASLWEKLQPHLGTDALATAVNESSRSVAFRSKPKTVNDFLAHVLAELGGVQ